MSIKMSHMQTHEAFNDSFILKRFLAEQLRHGRLALILGAGASQGFKLPNWNDLTSMLIAKTGINISKELSNEDQAEEIWNKYCGQDDVKFAELVREVLYKDYNTSLETLRKNNLLTALGALSVPSSRGHVRNIITFNFDDILETYLHHLGYMVNPVSNMPYWNSGADAQVFHIHGFLTSNLSIPVQSGIVMASIHFDRINENIQSIWKNVVLNIMNSNTCIFIGLSGTDEKLMKILTEANVNHVAITERHPYWGMRFTKNDDPLIEKWKIRGVFQQIIEDYDEIPDWLFSICQIAASIGPTP